MISRRILAAVALLCAFAIPAQAQKTKAVLNAEVATNWPDNTNGAITPSLLRSTVLDILNSIMPTAPVVSGNLACFNGTTGLLQDCGTSPSTFPSSGVIYTPSGTGAVARTVQNKLTDYLSVFDFGVTCNGSTDDRANIIVADSAAATAGKALRFPGGTCLVSSAITPSLGSHWVGDSYQATVLKINSAACSVLTVSNNNFTIEYIQFQSATTCASGTAINLTASEFRAGHLLFTAMWETFKFGSSVSVVLLDDIESINSPNTTTAGIVVNGCLNCQARNLIFTTNTTTLYHILFQNAGDFTCVDCNFIKATHNVVFQPTTGTTVASVNFIGGFIDQGSTSGVLVNPTAGSVLRSKFVGTWISQSGTANLNYAPTVSGVVDGIDFIDCEFFTGSAAGFNIAFSGTTSSILNQRFIGGKVSGAGGGSVTGINIAGVGSISIFNMKIGTVGGFGALNTGIAISGTNGTIQIIGNDLTGSTTKLTNSGTNTTAVIKDNLGYNPVGLTAGTSTGVSTSTITAGPSPETHYITQSANFNALVKSGSTSLCTVPSATVPCVIDLGPNEAYTVTWTTTQPTYSKFVH